MMALCQTRRILSKGLRLELGDAPLPLCPLPSIHRIADKAHSRKPPLTSPLPYAANAATVAGFLAGSHTRSIHLDTVLDRYAAALITRCGKSRLHPLV
jgi:hypothetical protein